MSEIKIRVAQLDDQGLLGELLKACLLKPFEDEAARAKEAGIPGATAEDELMAADDWYFANMDMMNCLYFAWDGKKAVGAIAVNTFASEIQHVVVLPEYRRRGIGRMLVEEGVAELKDRGAGHVKIDFPADENLAGAEEFFAALGFGKVRATVRMGKKLGE
ncbi:MAG: GNAT family N-acetyltransferase [Planctomycetes bacterium]|nr:GNAT family N-acetyltransferase [Planctomycetota bacterium]